MKNLNYIRQTKIIIGTVTSFSTISGLVYEYIYYKIDLLVNSK